MSITITEQTLIPVRRDGQNLFSASGGGGGGGISMGGGAVVSSNHNALTGLQGGQAAEYYHLTAAQNTALASMVTKTGTPVENQVAVWNSDSVIKGLSGLTYDGTTLTASNLSVGGTSAFTGLVSTTGGLHVGGSSNPGTDNLIVDGTSSLVGLVTTTGGLHVGGSSDPGTDNLIVDGTSAFTGLVSTTGGLHVGGSSDPGADNLTVDGNSVHTGTSTHTGATTFGNTAGTAVFSSGFSGSGWQVDTNNHLTLDSLTVRGTLNVYELVRRKLSAINGGFIVSVANAKSVSATLNSGVNYRIVIDEDNGNAQIQFVAGDYIKAQVFTGRNVAAYLGVVTAVNHSNTLGSAYVDADTVSGTPWNIMDLVQVGHNATSGRQNLIYITAVDDNNPYIDVLAGVTDGTFSGKTKVRLGNLTGITDSDLGGALSGYGLYSDNIYLKGKIVASSGVIGGWSIGASALYKDGGTAATSSGMSPTDFPFYAGAAYANRSTAKFRVTPAGTIYCEDLTIGSTGGSGESIYINGNNIFETGSNTDGGCIYMNWLGYQGGLTKYRDVVISDGRNQNTGILFYADGSAHRVGIYTQTAPDSTFQVATTNGAGLKINYNAGGTNNIYGATTSDNTITATNFILTSDRSLKTNITKLEIHPIEVEYKQFFFKNDLSHIRFGVIADEIQKTNPELVYKTMDGTLAVDYIGMLLRKVAFLEQEVKRLSHVSSR